MFLWPDGTELTVDEESRLDDSFVFSPTGSLDYQVMFSNLSERGSPQPPFLGTLVLLNP